MSEVCSGYRHPNVPTDPNDPLKARHFIDGTCIHGFFVTTACYSQMAAEIRAPVCCNESWSARLIGSFLDESGMPRRATDTGEKP